MPIVTDQGIFTEGLCANSKSYLSRLLVGKGGINPNFLTWDLLFTKRFNLHPLRETYQKNQTKDTIKNKLIELECQNHQQTYLESRKQQADLRIKKRGLITIGLLTLLAIGYFYILLLLSTTATFLGVCLGIGVTLICCCTIISTFLRERPIDPQWLKDYSILKKEYEQIIIRKIKGTYQTNIVNTETGVQTNHQSETIQSSYSLVRTPSLPNFFNPTSVEKTPEHNYTTIVHNYLILP